MAPHKHPGHSAQSRLEFFPRRRTAKSFRHERDLIAVITVTNCFFAEQFHLGSFPGEFRGSKRCSTRASSPTSASNEPRYLPRIAIIIERARDHGPPGREAVDVNEVQWTLWRTVQSWN
jgi:hypothetical protein